MIKILIRGGGDLASGIALRLFHCGFPVLITEIDQPRVLRRSVSFANAIFEDKTYVEEIPGIFLPEHKNIVHHNFSQSIPVIIDPDCSSRDLYQPDVIIDARMLKKFIPVSLIPCPLLLGLGPGFTGGQNCHAAIETNRGHFLGRVLWNESTQADTGIPGNINGKENERVLRAPSDGIIESTSKLGDLFTAGQEIAFVNHQPIIAPFNGCLRGLMHNGLEVKEGEKLGDLDPRLDPKIVNFVSEKSLAIAGGILEAILVHFGVGILMK